MIRSVLLDVTMPHMSGATVLHELRRIREDVTVILFSGYTEREVMERLSDERIAGFVQKPFRQADLITALRDAVTR